jgi:beta-lactamase regulating signal transducer with metallopeptidase domain/Leucine-rich repeat (LRR) protein
MTNLPAINILLDAGVKSVVVLALAGVMMAGMRKRSAAARHLLCFLAVASLLVLPVLSWALPGWRVLPGWLDFHGTRPVVVKQPATTYLTAETPAGIPPTPGRIEIATPVAPEIVPQDNGSSPTVQPAAAIKPAPARAKINFLGVGFLAWMAGVLLALVPVVLGIVSLHRLGRTSRCETAESWLELLRHLLMRLGFKRRVVLLQTAQRRMPMTWGVLRPKVLLPEESDQWPEDRRSVVLLHELAHAQRRDYLTHLITRLVCALYWFNPLVWLAARRMVAERERACDDIVLRHGAEPADYAEQVLEISAGLSLGWFAGYNGVAMARPSNLEGRLRAILDRGQNRATVTWFTMLAVLALLSVAVIPVAILKAAPADSGRGDNPPDIASTNLQPRTSAVISTSLENTPIQERKVSISAEQKPLQDVLAEICRQAGVELQLDADGLKMSGVSVDAPVTLKCQDEPLPWAVVRILRLLERQGVRDIYQDTRDGKLFVSSIMALNDRRTKAEPAWLSGYGKVGKLDDRNNIVSLYAGGKTDDAFLEKLKTLPKLRELDIEGTKFITPQGLTHLGQLPALERLTLYQVNEGESGLGDAALRNVSQIRTLRHLSIAESGVTDEGMRALAGMTQLTGLSLGGNSVTDAGLKYLAGLTNLQDLGLSQIKRVNSHMDITDDGLTNLSNLTRLQSLWIEGLERVTDVGLKHLSRLTELRNFVFAGTAVTTENISFPHLQSLDLTGSQVTDATLDNLGRFHDLQKLSLKYTSVTDAGMARIADLKELRQVVLDSGLITDAGIARLRTLPNLESAGLSGTVVSDASLHSLAGIKSLSQLTLTVRGEPGINPDGLLTMDGLLQLKNLPGLRNLTINGLVLPDGWLGVRELKQLTSLTMSFCSISDAEEDLLELVMPGTRVSAISGGSGGKLVMFNQPPKPVTLPDESVRITGVALDDVSGQPVGDCRLEFGADNPNQPGEMIWGESLPGGHMEVTGTDFSHTSRFWGESFRPGKVRARLLASGYQPALLTPQSVTASLQMTNLVVRLKRGGDFQGIVLDHNGKPAPGMRVYLANQPHFRLENGVENYSGNLKSAVTDANGRFNVSGGDGTPQKLVAASVDGRLFQVIAGSDGSRDLTVTLPQPATLVLHYDTPDDSPVAACSLSFSSKNLDQAIWMNTSFGLSLEVKNRSEIVLTNLTPGIYSLDRRKVLTVGSFESRRSRNERTVWLERTVFTLAAGSTQRVDQGRTSGDAVHGEVTGLAQTTAFGAYLYAFSDQITNSLTAMLNGDRPLDATATGRDGKFQTARLPPGGYNFVAIAFREPDAYPHSREPDYIGTAKVIVTADAPPEPVKIGLHPRIESAKSP